VFVSASSLLLSVAETGYGGVVTRVDIGVPGRPRRGGPDGQDKDHGPFRRFGISAGPQPVSGQRDGTAAVLSRPPRAGSGPVRLTLTVRQGGEPVPGPGRRGGAGAVQGARGFRGWS